MVYTRNHIDQSIVHKINDTLLPTTSQKYHVGTSKPNTTMLNIDCKRKICDSVNPLSWKNIVIIGIIIIADFNALNI